MKLNENPNKDQVIHAKILKYYFVGCFDLGPFSTMPLSVLPQVMSVIGQNGEDDEQKIQHHHAIFRMLKGLPELCNVTSREQMTKGTSAKRQKISAK